MSAEQKIVGPIRISTHIKGDRLGEYARKLIEDDFTVWVPNPRADVNGDPIPASWFMYEKNSFVGMVSEGLGGFSHSMPIEPSREDGSAIAMFDADWPLHVEHAEKVCRAENRGKYNGNRVFKNQGLTKERMLRYVQVGKDPEITVPMKVVWQEVNQYSAVVEVKLNRQMLKSKKGRQLIHQRIDEQIDLMNEEDLNDSLDEYWGGPHRHHESMEALWNQVETPPEV